MPGLPMGIVDLDLSLLIPLHPRTTKDEHFFHKFTPLPNTSVTQLNQIRKVYVLRSISVLIKINARYS